MAARSVVWILGAGFSRSLGAPLLADVLTNEGLDRAASVYPELYKLHRVREVVRVCQAGAYGFPHSKAIERQWEHAEEFLERLDLAERDRLKDAALARVWTRLLQDYGSNKKPIDVSKLRTTALRVLAGECCAFLENADPASERWAPYLRWAQSLSPADTVITFNYDHVPEFLGAHSSELHVPTPAELAEKPLQRDTTPVLKMHGSVDWVVASDGSGVERIVRSKDKSAAVRCHGDQLAIATPGPTKKAMITNPNRLEKIWLEAEKAILKATAIVFLGYRIPPTDAHTRSFLLSHMRENISAAAEIPRPPPTRQPPLVIHTVLGADINSVDSRRLKGLCDSISGTRLNQHPMFAEDFLDTFSRQHLFVY